MADHDGWHLQRQTAGRPYAAKPLGDTGRWTVVDRTGAVGLVGPEGTVEIDTEEQALKLAGWANAGVLGLAP